MTKLTQNEIIEWKKYRKPGTNFYRMKVNELNVTPANSWEHEAIKCKLYWEHRKQGHAILTEAEEIGTKLRRDLVCLSCGGEIFEIENSSMKRGRRHSKSVNVFWYDLNRMRNKEEVMEDENRRLATNSTD